MPHVLVLAGAKGGQGYDVAEAVFGYGLADCVVMTGYLPDDMLPYVYNGADAFAYLSLYEGFGLPPLEAMACGVPTLVSNSTSLPEVVGARALIVDAYDMEAMAGALVQICTDDELRETLARQGRQRAAQFSWQLAAWDTLALYKRMLTGDRRGVEDAHIPSGL